MKTFKQHQLVEASMYDYLWKKHKGIFFRGTGQGGRGTGMGALGKGVYLSWSEGMAKAYANRTGKGTVKQYKIKRGLKICDAETDKDFADIKKDMGLGVRDYSDDPMFAGMLTMMLMDKGYDGCVSDDVATGICIFKEKHLKEIK